MNYLIHCLYTAQGIIIELNARLRLRKGFHASTVRASVFCDIYRGRCSRLNAGTHISETLVDFALPVPFRFPFRLPDRDSISYISFVIIILFVRILRNRDVFNFVETNTRLFIYYLTSNVFVWKKKKGDAQRIRSNRMELWFCKVFSRYFSRPVS